MKYISTSGYQTVFEVDSAVQIWIIHLHGIQWERFRTEEDGAYDWMSRIGFLIHPNGEMMKTLSDKAMTNQSHCEKSEDSEGH